MAFADLLVHKANIYTFNIDSRDDYNIPELKLTVFQSNVPCRIEYFIPKVSGTPQQEIELIEEQPIRLFLPNTHTLTHSNYVFRFSVDSTLDNDNYYIIQELKPVHAGTSAVHHYELMVVPLEEKVIGTYSIPS